MDKLSFRVSSALKDLVGKDLVTSENVAIFELVKNSYDAYATKVEITFSDDKIVIADNGKGMTFDDLKKKWLFLGYSAKKDGTEDRPDQLKQKSYRDRIKRRYAGAKGIGRFSCDRLGKKLLLITKSESAESTEKIAVNWADFENDQQTEFTEVEIDHTSVTRDFVVFPDGKKTGTILEISSLNAERSRWDRAHILDLKRSLEKLINPLAESEDFSIEIICEREKAEDLNESHDRDIVNGILKNSIAEIFKIKTTQIDVRLNSEYIETTLSDRGVDIYKIREKNINFKQLVDVRINLYFLNRSAKYSFTRLMGIEPVNYGSIFLFRNGFRIMPFGNTGDDSWGLDYRAQQGRSRFLGTRDLFGRVDVLTDNVDELKEVSSRDGGLIETRTSRQLFELFKIAHRRLERYVSGVLWGGGFLQREYFATEAEALKKRKELLDIDKDEDDPNYIFSSSMGSKIDFVQLIKTLIKDKNVEVLYYNTELANIFSLSTGVDTIKPQFIRDLEKIAENTNNSNLLASVEEAKHRISELQREKEVAEARALDEEQRRIAAEKSAKDADLKKREAEKKAELEREKKREAVLRAKEAELKRREAEVLRKEAEKEAEDTKAAKKRIEADLEQERKQGIFQRSIIGREKEQILGLQHQISHSSGRIKTNIRLLLDSMSEANIHLDLRMQKIISVISLESEKIESLSNFVTCANFDLKASTINQDLASFIEEYIAEIYLPDVPVLQSRLNIKVTKTSDDFRLKFRPLEITTVIDNFIQNSEKAGAENIVFSMKKNNEKIIISIQDDGKGIPAENISKIFDLGFTTTDGSGIGLFNVKSIVSRLKGRIDVRSDMNKGTIFEVIL